MAVTSNIAAEARDRVGKGAARALRRTGRVPAVVYGDNKDPIAISLDRNELIREIANPGFFRRLYDIKLDGVTHRTLPRDVQKHPVTDVPQHVDFLRVSAKAKIAVAVIVIFENEEESPGLKRGGVLNIVRREIELVCPATAIPEAVHVDLSGLEIGDGVHISSIALPPDCEPTITDRDFTVATIASPTLAIEEAKAEEEGEEGIEGEITEGALEAETESED